MGVLKDRTDDRGGTTAGGGGDMERFVAFLRREAAAYHEPPKAPADEMWAAVEARLAEDAVVDDADERFVEALGYHEPPPAPRDAMWARIESARVARRPVEQESSGTASRPVRLAAVRGLGRRTRRTVIWLTGAAAASVALAVGLDRGARLPVPAEPETVAAAAPASVGAAASAVPLVAATDSGPTAPTAAEEALALAAVEEPLETNRPFEAAPPPAADPAPRPVGIAAVSPANVAASPPPQRPVRRPGRATADEYDMARHLDQAETLLVAFRTDSGSDESQLDLARWAREMLVETRSLLAAPVSEGERERGLLQDLELVLVQIARLGPDAADFERDLARESMRRQGALLRLRSTIGT